MSSGLNTIYNGATQSGTGRVIIPYEVNRAEYIKDCYNRGVLTIHSGVDGTVMNHVRCTREVIQNIKFPEKYDEFGTIVVWVRDSILSSPIIIGSLPNENEQIPFNENSLKINRSIVDKFADINISGDDALISIDILGNDVTPSELRVRVNSNNKQSKVFIETDNELFITADNKVNIVSSKQIFSSVEDESGKVISEIDINGENISIISKDSINLNVKDDVKDRCLIKYDNGVGFYYKDEYNNEVKANASGINIVANEISHNSGSTPMVLGDELVSILNNFLSEVTKIKVITPQGISTNPINSTQFTIIKNKLIKILSLKSKLE